VRELENVTRKALLAAQGYTITLDHVRAALNKTGGEMYSAMRPFGEYVDELLAATRRGEITDIMRVRLKRPSANFSPAPFSRPRAIKPKPPGGLASRASP
jgi:hypothetical protein